MGAELRSRPGRARRSRSSATHPARPMLPGRASRTSRATGSRTCCSAGTRHEPRLRASTGVIATLARTGRSGGCSGRGSARRPCTATTGCSHSTSRTTAGRDSVCCWSKVERRRLRWNGRRYVVASDRIVRGTRLVSASRGRTAARSTRGTRRDLIGSHQARLLAVPRDRLASGPLAERVLRRPAERAAASRRRASSGGRGPGGRRRGGSSDSSAPVSSRIAARDLDVLELLPPPTL